MCECVYACFAGSLVYNFKVGLSQQRVEASGPRVGVCCEGHHKKNVLLKSGQMYVSLLQLIMASRITDFCSLFDFLSIPLTGSIQPQLASRFGLSFILLLQPLWATLSHNVIIGPMMACPQDKFFVNAPHTAFQHIPGTGQNRTGHSRGQPKTARSCSGP